MCKHGVFLLGLLLVCDDQRGCFSIAVAESTFLRYRNKNSADSLKWRVAGNRS
jgi:hypothetical protein